MHPKGWHFSIAELQCKCGCKRADMSDEFMARLELLREALQRPLLLSSAFRCPAYNDRVSHTGTTGPHTSGRAVDIVVHGPMAFALVSLAARLGFTGIGVQQKGELVRRFVHLDDLPQIPGRPRPWLWSY